ncbi:MAG: AsmA family protein [Longimicrobiales bacterium]
MNRRRILFIAVAGLVLVIGGLVLTVALIPEERVADALARRAEAALGEPVAIDRVGIALFPLPGVRLSGLTVGADSTALARIDRAEARVRILPLFGRRVVVRSLELHAPRIAVEIDREGVSNFPVIEPDSTAEASTADIDFAVDRVRITDGSLRYTNHQDGTRVRLDGWSQELAISGAVEEGTLTSLVLTGWVGADDVDATLSGAVLPARDLALRVDHDATLDLDQDRLELRELEVDFEGVTLAGSGRVEGVNSGRPGVQIDLAADGIDAARLMAWVPDSMRAQLALPDGREVGLRGTASLRATIDGTLAPDTLPAVEGRLNLSDGAVTVGSENLVEGVGGQAVFSLDSVVARFDGRLLGQGFNTGVAVRNPDAPVAVVALSGRADLGRLAPLGLVSDTLDLAGDVRIDLRTQLPVNDLATARATGTIDATGVALAGMDPVVRVPTATARFEGGQVRVSPFRIELGPDRSTIELDITADGWIPAAVDSAPAPPRLAVDMEAGALDLDALFGPSTSGYPSLLFARLRDRPIEGRSAGAIAEEMGLAIPALPPVDARIDASVESLVRNGLRYTDMTALAHVTQDLIVLEQLRFGLMGGIVDANGEVEPLRTDSVGAPIETRLAGRFGVTSVGARPFFDTLTPFKDHLSGRLDMAGTVGMTLDRFALPVRESLGSVGTLAIADGRLANWVVLTAIGERLGVTAFDTLRFRDWAGSFHIDGPRVTLDETALDGSEIDARAGGWFDFGGQLDVSATAALAPELARRAGAIGGQILTASPDNAIPVGLRIHGNVESPDVTLDLDPAREAVTDRVTGAVEEAAQEAQDAVRGAAEEAAQDVRDRAAREAAGRFELPDSLRDLPADSLRTILGDSVYELLPDSVRLRADSLQQAIENAIRERLRRLLPGGGGGDGGGGGP